MLARWAAPLSFLSYLLVDLHLILKNSAGIHAGSDIQCELLQWVKKLRPKPKLEQTWPLRRMTPSPWRLCRVVSRVQSSLPRTLNWEEGEDLLFCAIISYHFGPRERRCWIDRSPFRMDTCGSPRTRLWGVERAAGRAAAILGQSDVPRGQGFGFEFGRWLASSTERVRSRSPCGVRMRD